MDEFASEITSVLYGNPHSSSPSSQHSTSRIEDARMNLLSFFNADPAEYDVVFVANATAGVKLVVDAMRCQPQGFFFAYHQACHTSLVGAREEALQSSCLEDSDLQDWLNGESPFGDASHLHPSTTLFAYPAQSHMDGKRYPLTWGNELERTCPSSMGRLYTLLDASSFCATSPLDLGNPDITADFIVLSLYKIFGFPDLGALIVRHSTASVFNHRKYFGGGTVDMVVTGKEQWHASKSYALHARLEDGTLPFHSIVALDIAMAVHRRLFGSMNQISSHTSYLTYRLLEALKSLRHANGEPVCSVYTTSSSESSPLGPGPAVSFNLLNSSAAWASLAEFEKLATLKKMHIRTGGLCCPGGIASALNLHPWEMRRNFSAGFRCGDENDVISGKPTGVIRVSLGAMSTRTDVDRFVDFIKEFYQEDMLPSSITSPAEYHPISPTSPKLRVKSVTVYPIKSCAGFAVPAETPWEVRSEGLAWDREWCLVHQGSGYALSQKRCPKMALLQPVLDFSKGELIVTYRGDRGRHVPAWISVPLSADPTLFDTTHDRQRSRVCGDEISARVYTSEYINDFFSQVLGLPCRLARFPPGGQGASSRLSKAQVQRHQQPKPLPKPPGSFPDVPSPPDSDTEQQKPGRILLSNESPILMIHSESVVALNKQIVARGGRPVAERAFRANVVLEHAPDTEPQPAFCEDNWESVSIGQHGFELLGACRRCQMVCIDQETGEKKEEPYVTLAKTRRFDGKVYFGVHMRHDHGEKDWARKIQYPTIQVGDAASAESRK